jgi:hypothetical protein
MTSRQRFEEWASTRLVGARRIRFGLDMDGESYTDWQVQFLWECWQESEKQANGKT